MHADCQTYGISKKEGAQSLHQTRQNSDKAATEKTLSNTKYVYEVTHCSTAHVGVSSLELFIVVDIFDTLAFHI